MSTFEIVRGVDGDCLMLDGTRICGPKPWGGGRIINTFRTDGIYEVIDKDECRKLKADNAKLRELVRHMHTCMEHYEMDGTISCDRCPLDNCVGNCDYERRMRELGVEVDA